MGKLRPLDDRYQEGRVRIIWDRHDVYESVRALVRGRRVHQRRIAFFDREEGVLTTVPQVTDCVTFTPWPRSRNAANLAQLSMSANPLDRRAAQAVLATTSAGTSIDLERDCFVYLLSDPQDEVTEHLGQVVPLGGFEPTRGQANWAVGWDQLREASSCTDLRREAVDETDGVEE